MYLSNQLRTIEQTLAEQPLPRNWSADDPAFDGVSKIGVLIGALRDFTDQERADQIVLALLDMPLGRRPHVEPHMLLLIGMSSRLRAAHRGMPAESCDDLLADLAALLCEPGLAASLEGRSRLCEVLTRRAGRRHQRRHATRRRHADRFTPTDSHHFDWMVGTNLHGEQEAAIVDRLALVNFRTVVTNGIERGEISATQWTHFINGVLIPALDLTKPPARPNTRINIPRARHSIANHIHQALAA
jgi:hypothetical protein